MEKIKCPKEPKLTDQLEFPWDKKRCLSVRHLQSLQLHLGWHPLNGQAPSLALPTVLGQYPGITFSTNITHSTQAVPTVPRLYLQYPGCPATDITLALDCYYSPPALHTQQPSLFGGQLLWKERERAEPFHSLECTGSLKPAFQTSFESYLPRNKEKNSLACKCILVVVV